MEGGKGTKKADQERKKKKKWNVKKNCCWISRASNRLVSVPSFSRWAQQWCFFSSSKIGGPTVRKYAYKTRKRKKERKRCVAYKKKTGVVLPSTFSQKKKTHRCIWQSRNIFFPSFILLQYVKKSKKTQRFWGETWKEMLPFFICFPLQHVRHWRKRGHSGNRNPPLNVHTQKKDCIKRDYFFVCACVLIQSRGRHCNCVALTHMKSPRFSLPSLSTFIDTFFYGKLRGNGKGPMCIHIITFRCISP